MQLSFDTLNDLSTNQNIFLRLYQKDSLVINIAGGKKKLKELEDEILRLLNEAQGSLLDDETLVNTLQSSKITSAEVTESLIVSEQTEAKIDQAREVSLFVIIGIRSFVKYFSAFCNLITFVVKEYQIR